MSQGLTNDDLLVRSGMLAALVEASPAAILMLDLEKRVTMWNPACERIFGWTADEVMGQPYPIVPADQWAQFEGFFSQVVSGQGFSGVEAIRARKDGHLIHLAISTAPIRDAAGTVVGAMAILEDVTERKQLELRYRQAQKMEAVGRLAGGIAHDFNNVLTVILSYCDALLMTQDPARMLSDIGAIQRAAERAAELTRQLLAFGRRQVLQTSLLDLNEVVRGSAEMLRRLIGEDIAIHLELAPDAMPIRADASQVERMLMNLAANARDAMPDGGTLFISTRSARRSTSDPAARWVLLSLRDTGVGMDEDTIAHVFEPFFTTKELGRGTGLGLASVYGVVRQSQGDVDVISAPGQGAEFRIWLPQAEGTEAPAAPGPAVTTTLQRGTILVAEDDGEVRAVVHRVLAARGFTVLEAADGFEALAVASAHPGAIDLLLTDVVMEGMNGRQLAERFIEDRPEGRVLFMSGYTDDEVLRRGVHDGARFLHKPFTPEGLIAAILAALDS